MKRLWLTAFFLLLSCSPSETPKVENPPSLAAQNAEKRLAALVKAKEAVAPFFVKMGTPQKGDWLENTPEAGETFEQYLANKPLIPTAEKHTVYIQPVGEFSAKQRSILLLAAAYMRVFYNLPVRLMAEKSLANVPPKWTRKNEYSGQTQIETTYFLDDFLPQALPPDAAALICLTTSDLYPKEGWSFVFGQADLRGRVGVGSFYRLENSEKGAADDKLLLARTLKIATHETGHMFSMRHCAKYECLMSGTNNLSETDRRPLDVCPECMAKICWAMNYDPAERYAKLAKFCAKQGWTSEAELFTKKAKAVNNLSEKGD